MGEFVLGKDNPEKTYFHHHGTVLNCLLLAEGEVHEMSKSNR